MPKHICNTIKNNLYGIGIRGTCGMIIKISMLIVSNSFIYLFPNPLLPLIIIIFPSYSGK